LIRELFLGEVREVGMPGKCPQTNAAYCSQHWVVAEVQHGFFNLVTGSRLATKT